MDAVDQHPSGSGVQAVVAALRFKQCFVTAVDVNPRALLFARYPGVGDVSQGIVTGPTHG